MAEKLIREKTAEVERRFAALKADVLIKNTDKKIIDEELKGLDKMKTDTLINIEEHIRNFSDVLLETKMYAKNFGIPLSDAISILLLLQMSSVHYHLESRG